MGQAPVRLTIDEFVERAVKRAKCPTEGTLLAEMATEGTLLAEMATEFNSNDGCISQTARSDDRLSSNWWGVG